MFATIEDVKRVMGISPDDESQDGEITAALETAESWLERKLGPQFVAGEDRTESYFSVRSDGVIRLPVDDAEIAEVRLVGGGSLGYKRIGPNRIRLVGDGFWPYTALPAQRTTYYEEVQVIFASEGNVPAAIRDAAALLAAELVPQVVPIDENGDYAGHYKSERIGDYQYTLPDDALDTGVPGNKRTAAMRLLRPWLRRRKVAVI